MGDRAQVHIVANKNKQYNHDVWLYTHWGWSVMKLSNEYYQYLGHMQRWGKLDQTKEYTEWLEEELIMEWETNGYPYNHPPSSQE